MFNKLIFLYTQRGKESLSFVSDFPSLKREHHSVHILIFLSKVVLALREG